jgi:hypothetical protein
MKYCALLVLPFALAQAFAADADSAIRDTFVPGYVSALRSKDIARIRTFLHPQVRACMNENTAQFFDFLSRSEADDDVQGDYRVTHIVPVNGPAPLLGLPPDGFAYPIQPAYEVHVEFRGGKLEVVRFVAEAGGAWFEVYPCPNEKGVAFTRAYAARADEQRKRVEQLAAGVKEPLLAELKALVKDGRVLDAVKRYQDASGVRDLTTARMVVGVLERQ